MENSSIQKVNDHAPVPFGQMKRYVPKGNRCIYLSNDFRKEILYYVMEAKFAENCQMDGG